MRVGDVDDMPAALTADEIARLFSVGTDHVYSEVRAGRWPTPVVRIGRALRFPTVPALEVLGLATPNPEREERTRLNTDALSTVSRSDAKSKGTSHDRRR